MLNEDKPVDDTEDVTEEEKRLSGLDERSEINQSVADKPEVEPEPQP